MLFHKEDSSAAEVSSWQKISAVNLRVVNRPEALI
jgi:hypothetical protein